MELLIFFICFTASVAGSICGVGGGVFMKPLLDSFGIMDVAAVSFLCGLCVLAMAATNMLRQRKQHLVEARIGSFLAIGAVAGGALGHQMFQAVKAYTGSDALVGSVQSLILAVITLLTLLYSALLRERLPSYHMNRLPPCILLGIGMGAVSSFLGIGGGPINLAVLYFAFSMETKKAAANSLYIILCSQLSGFLMSCIRRTIPHIRVEYLAIMVFAGVIGGAVGSHISRRISAGAANKLFSGLLIAIAALSLHNAWKFFNA